MTSLIIDDEELARYALKKKLVNYPDIEVIGEANSVKQGIVKIKELNPELLFLDIQMNDGTGFDLINKVDYAGKIIFITAYDEFALRAFEINAIDYLLKPISDERLSNALKKTGTEENSTADFGNISLNYDDRLMVVHKKSINFIRIKSIAIITASREYTYIHTLDGREYLNSNSITKWENNLPDQNFCRIHRSTIINLDHVLNIDYHISGVADVFIQGWSEPYRISRNYLRRMKERYGI